MGFGILFLIIVGGVFIVFLLVGLVVDCIGVVLVSKVLVVVIFISFIVIGFVFNVLMLVLILFVVGFLFGGLDVVMNGWGVEVEIYLVRLVMFFFYGLFSFGVVVGV